MQPIYKLRVSRRKLVDAGGQLVWKPPICIVDENGESTQRFFLMCDAIESDVQEEAGPHNSLLKMISSVEAGEVEKIEADGNAWVAHITRQKVWFEGLYSQGEGGEVSLAQYKLAVETYLRFMGDPDFKPIEVDFPA
jgi:hypothetical protein